MFDDTIKLKPHEFVLIARQRLGLTQGELAKVLGVKPFNIGRYERTETPIPKAVDAKIKRLAKDPEAAWGEIEQKGIKK